MKYLFVHQNFPGQFLHLIKRLAASGSNELVFITEPNKNRIPGVRMFCYNKPLPNAAVFPDATEFELALRRARIVEGAARELLKLGYTPDIIIGHHGWGELLNMKDVWPGVPMLGYFEFFYHDAGVDVGFDPEFPPSLGTLARVRVKNAINLLALNNPGHGQTPTRFQQSTYPAWAHERIEVLAEGVDLRTCRPAPGVRRAPLELDGFRVEPGDTLVTYVARDLEPYRGFHTMMRALPRIQRLRGDLKVVMVGGDGVSYGAKISGGQTWRDTLMAEVGAVIDRSRLHFPGRVDYELFVRLLQRSDAHVYLTYPFVLSWSLREALACGCALVASDTAPVREFVADRETGLLVDFPNPAALADGVAELLEDGALARRLRRNARAFAEANFNMTRYLASYEALIRQVMSR